MSETRPCHYCSAMGAEPVADAEHEAYWLDTDGSRSGPYWVCGACLRAGHPSGPGYALAEEDSEP